MLVFASWGSAECGSGPLRVIIDFADGLGQGTLLRVGWVRSDVTHRANVDTSIVGTASDSFRWFRVKASAEHSELLLAVLQVAASHFGLCGCIGARIGRAASSLEAIAECDHTFIWWWFTDRPQQYWYFQTEGSGRVKLTDVFGKDYWTRCSFVLSLIHI